MEKFIPWMFMGNVRSSVKVPLVPLVRQARQEKPADRSNASSNRARPATPSPAICGSPRTMCLSSRPAAHGDLCEVIAGCLAPQAHAANMVLRACVASLGFVAKQARPGKLVNVERKARQGTAARRDQ
jgi:hypothetical protein